MLSHDLKIIKYPFLLEQAALFPKFGNVIFNGSDYMYLKVDDRYISNLFPLIGNIKTNLELSAYSPPEKIGAHISVFYPEELNTSTIQRIDKSNMLNSECTFQILTLAEFSVLGSHYIALTVEATPLENIRIQLGLDKELRYKGIVVPFHITIAKGKAKT